MVHWDIRISFIVALLFGKDYSDVTSLSTRPLSLSIQSVQISLGCCGPTVQDVAPSVFDQKAHD